MTSFRNVSVHLMNDDESGQVGTKHLRSKGKLEGFLLRSKLKFLLLGFFVCFCFKFPVIQKSLG